MNKVRIKCEYDSCHRSYCSYFNLKRHVESSHLGIRKFHCQVCGKYLSSKQNYIDHQNIHTGIKPYSCEYSGCGLTFRQLSQYYLHKQQLHSERLLQLASMTNLHNQMLAILTDKIGQESNYQYSIPLLPYSISNLQLPEIIHSQEFKIPSLLLK